MYFIVSMQCFSVLGKVDKARLIEMLSEEKGTNQNFPEQMTEYILVREFLVKFFLKIILLSRFISWCCLPDLS